jgi:hypothetical protein
MQPIDIEEVKRVSAKLGRRHPAQTRMPLTSPALTKSQRGIRELLQSYLAKSGFPVDELNNLRAAIRKEQRKLVEARMGETAKNLAADEIVLRQGLENFRQAAMLLKGQFQSHLVTLDQPFLIWQYPYPQSNIFLGSQTAPNNSFIKIKVDTHSGRNHTYFSFHFFWTNESKFAAVVRAHTSLIFNGSLVAEADGSFPSYVAYAEVELGASHTIWRWNGWGNDPVTGTSLDETKIFEPYYHGVADLYTDRSGIFDDVGGVYQELTFQPFFLNANPIWVPPFATIMYEVQVDLDYSGYDDDDFSVSADFATDDLGRRIICPSAVLEVSYPFPVSPS